MLDIQNLSFGYGHSGKLVIDNLSLQLPQGVVAGLLAPNGTGKTTLLHLIMGALTPRKGRVVFDGVNTRDRRPETLAEMMLVPEEITLPSMNINRFMTLYGSLYPRFSREIMERCIEEFRITDINKLNALSMGQKKKVYLSFALACRPKLLLMDEPTNGLDIPGKAALRRLMAGVLDEDTTVIISTHQVRDLEQMLEQIIIMDRGNLLFNHSVSEIQSAVAFRLNVPADATEGAIDSVPAPGGYNIMVENLDGDESPVNLEMLFDYVMREHEHMNALIDNALKTQHHDEL